MIMRVCYLAGVFAIARGQGIIGVKLMEIINFGNYNVFHNILC